MRYFASGHLVQLDGPLHVLCGDSGGHTHLNSPPPCIETWPYLAPVRNYSSCGCPYEHVSPTCCGTYNPHRMECGNSCWHEHDSDTSALVTCLFELSPKASVHFETIDYGHCLPSRHRNFVRIHQVSREKQAGGPPSKPIRRHDGPA